MTERLRWCGEVPVLAICSTLAARRVDSSSSTTDTIHPNKNRRKENLLKPRNRGLPSNFHGPAAQGQRSQRFTCLGLTRICFGGLMEEVGGVSIQEDGKTVSYKRQTNGRGCEGVAKQLTYCLQQCFWIPFTKSLKKNWKYQTSYQTIPHRWLSCTTLTNACRYTVTLIILILCTVMCIIKMNNT